MPLETIHDNNHFAMNDAMELQVPATPEFVSTARLFAAEASRHLGVAEEAVADLKIAISEACTGAIDAQQAASNEDPVRLIIEPLDDSLKVEVLASAGFDRLSGMTEPPDGLGLGLIKALFPDAEFLNGRGQSSTLRILVPVQAEP